MYVQLKVMVLFIDPMTASIEHFLQYKCFFEKNKTIIASGYSATCVTCVLVKATCV